jgi:hypothetical protein
MPYGVTAQYPTAIVSSFTTHVNQTEIIDASHPNLLQAEVQAIETTLGITPENSGNFTTTLSVNGSGSTSPSISTYVYTGYTTFNTFSDRVTNVENLAATAYAATSGIATVSSTVTTHTTLISNLSAISSMGGY